MPARGPLAAVLGLLALAPTGTQLDPPEVQEIPFEFVKRQILLDVHVEGRGPFLMALDTAASPSGLDESVAAAVDLDTSRPIGFVSGLGSRRIPYRKATLGAVSLKNFRLADLPTIVFDASHLVLDGRQVLGILGESFVRRAWVQVDYPARVVRLVANDHRSSGFPEDCSETDDALDARFSTFLRLLDVKVDGRPVEATLDTGAHGGLQLPLSEARRLGLGELWETAEKAEAYGARGAFEARKTKIDSLRIGSFELTDVETLISPQATGVLIGNGALEEFVLTVDYLRGRVCLSRP